MTEKRGGERRLGQLKNKDKREENKKNISEFTKAREGNKSKREEREIKKRQTTRKHRLEKW